MFYVVLEMIGVDFGNEMRATSLLVDGWNTKAYFGVYTDFFYNDFNFRLKTKT